MAKSPKKPRRGTGGEHDPAVNTAAGAPSKGVSVDPAVNTAADAPSMGVSVDPGESQCTKWYHTAYVVTANTSFAFTIYGMKWDLRPLGILPRGVLVEVYYL